MKRLLFTLFVWSFVVQVLPVYAQGIDARGNDVKQILKIVSPSIVKVVFENEKRNFSSGVAIDPNHVVSSIFITQFPAETIYIQDVQGKNFPAKLVGKDEESQLILLSIKERALTPIARAKKCEAGDWAALVGTFYKQFPGVLQGIVSSSSDDELFLNAPSVPGSSGGAVINKKGELLGIIIGRFGFAMSPDYIFRDASSELHIQGIRNKNQDLCIAIPSGKAFEISEELKKYGKVRRAWMGVQFNCNINGVFISDVTRKSPAEKADIRRNDEILRINGKNVSGIEDILTITRVLKPDQVIKVDLRRGDEKKSIAVTLGEAKPKNFNNVYPGSGENAYFPWDSIESIPHIENYVFNISGSKTLGIEVISLNPELARELNIPNGTGVMISKVNKDTAADKAGFRPSDVITKIGNTVIKDISDLRKMVNSSPANKPINVEFNRKGKVTIVKVTPDKNVKLDEILENIKDKMQDVKQYKIKTTTEKQQPGESKQQKELEKYKNEIEKMRKEQIELQKKMEAMMKLIEAQQKEKEQKEKQEKEKQTETQNENKL